MPIVKIKPTSNGRRAVVKVVNPQLHKGEPHAPLLEKKGKVDGRNNYGRITVRHRGGAHKRHYRVIDFKRDKDGIVGFLGTHARTDTVMAGPFEAISPFIGRNLIELYENALRSAGLQMYWFHVTPGEWQNTVDRSEFAKKIEQLEDGSTIYRRTL